MRKKKSSDTQPIKDFARTVRTCICGHLWTDHESYGPKFTWRGKCLVTGTKCDCVQYQRMTDEELARREKVVNYLNSVEAQINERAKRVLGLTENIPAESAKQVNQIDESIEQIKARDTAQRDAMDKLFGSE